mmetsp:Transcript_16882/g.38991  ORF Transcript_16882/g.38991 Transcript_16882/m.38991 type:complete len:539 (-) Transcript_16882:511-2127(-)
MPRARCSRTRLRDLRFQAPFHLSGLALDGVDCRPLQVVFQHSIVPQGVVLVVVEADPVVLLLDILAAVAGVRQHVLHAPDHVPLQAGVQGAAAGIPSDGLPELRQSQASRPVLVGDHVLARRVDVPAVRPGSNAQGDFFSHEAPRGVGVEGDVPEERAVGEEEAGGDEGNLRGIRGVPRGQAELLDAQNFVLDVVFREMASAQSLSAGSALEISIVLLEAGWVGTQDRLRVVFGSLHLADVVVVPLGRKFQVGVHLHEVIFSPPELARVIPGCLGAERIRVVKVQDPDLSVLAKMLVVLVGAKLLDAVRVWRGGTDRGLRLPVRKRSDDLNARFASHPVESEAVLDHGSYKELVGIFRLVESAHHRFGEQVFAEGGKRNEYGSVVANGEDGAASVRIFEWINNLRREIVICIHHAFFVDMFSRLGSMLLFADSFVLDVKLFQVFVEEVDDTSYCWFVVVKQIVDQLFAVLYFRKNWKLRCLRKQVRCFERLIERLDIVVYRVELGIKAAVSFRVGSSKNGPTVPVTSFRVGILAPAAS